VKGASAVASDAPPARSTSRRADETETDSRDLRDVRALDVRVLDARLSPANARGAKSRADDDAIEPLGETTRTGAETTREGSRARSNW
jgi:hypothetical protein